jgi:hypothetical protein
MSDHSFVSLPYDRNNKRTLTVTKAVKGNNWLYIIEDRVYISFSRLETQQQSNKMIRQKKGPIRILHTNYIIDHIQSNFKIRLRVASSPAQGAFEY